MASRYANKPDPSIKKNVLRSRSAAYKARNAHASVIITSLLGTILAWATFSFQDAEVMAASQAAASVPAPLTITAERDLSILQASPTRALLFQAVTR